MDTNIWINIISEYLYKDDTISEIESNGGYSIFIRRNGIREEIKGVFQSAEQYLASTNILARIVTGKDQEHFEFLEEGKLDLKHRGTARVHIVFPPASDFPLVTIAKKTTTLTTLEDIMRKGSMSQKMLNFIKAAVDIKQTIVFSGSTGSGKTTFLEAATKCIPMDTRIGVVEDSPELSLLQPNTVYLHSQPWKPGMNPNNEVTLDWNMRQINRMRTDRVIIGETRGKEFAQFLTAANSGQEGSLTTLHANSPKSALQKMTQFVMEAHIQPVRIINKNIATTIDLIIQLEKFPNGEYKTTNISAVSETLTNDDSATISTTALTEWDPVNKTWKDRFLIPDKMRYKLESAGYDCSSFTKNTSYNKNNFNFAR